MFPGEPAAVTWNANGRANWLFTLVKLICICYRISSQGGNHCCSALCWWHGLLVESHCWSERVFFFSFEFVKFVHKIQWEQHLRLPVRFELSEVDIPLCVIFFILVTQNKQLHISLWCWFDICTPKTAGAFLFLEHVGIKLSLPGEKKQSEWGFNLSHCWCFASDFFDLSLTKSRGPLIERQNPELIPLFCWSLERLSVLWFI